MKYIQILINKRTCDLNIQDDNGDTALHIAACSKWNSAKKIQCLLECERCDPNITNKQGYTPLHIATVNSQFDSLLLNSIKCNPNIQDPHGNTALHLSIRQKSATGIEHFLMCDKVDVNIQNRQGDTPLHVVVKHGIPVGIIEVLLRSCDPNKQNENGDTPLHIVCEKESFDSNTYFLQALISTPGIDPEVANHAGLTPAEVAGEKYFVIQTIDNFLKQKQSSLQTYLKIFVVEFRHRKEYTH